MCIDVDGHHSGGNSIVNEIDFFLLLQKFVCITTGTSSALRKNRSMSPSI